MVYPLEELVPKRHWFVFKNESSWGWWSIATRHRKGFGHVFCFSEIPRSDGFILVTNPSLGRVEHFLVVGRTWKLIREFLESGDTVVVAKIESVAHIAVRRGPLMTCATILAYHGGLPFRGVTPWQPYKALLDHGGTDLELHQEAVRGEGSQA